jgi:hypothetical protein
MMQPQSIFVGTKTWKRRDADLPPTPQLKWDRCQSSKAGAHETGPSAGALRDGALKRGRCKDHRLVSD